MAGEKKASKRKGADSTVTDSKTTKRAKLENGTEQPAKKSKTNAAQAEEPLPATKRATRPKATDFIEEKAAVEASAEKEAASAKAIKATKATKTTKNDDEAVAKPKSRKTTGKNKDVKKAEIVPEKAQATAKVSKAKKPNKAAEEKEETADEPKTVEKPKAKKGKKLKSNGNTAPPPKEDEEFGGFSSDDDAPRNMEETAALLAGFESSSEESSSDEGIAINKLPAPPKPSKAVLAAARQGNGNESESSGVLYIGRIPHGFHELQMRAYFSQFGSIANLRLARNRRTGAPKHYAFIEFHSAAVADIVARTMDKYLLFGHILQVRVMPKEQVHGEMWKGANKRFKKIPWGAIEARGLRVKRERGVWSGRIENEVARREKKMKVLEEFGYEFDMPSVKRVEDLPTRKRIDDEAVVAGEDGEASKAIEDVPVVELLLETTKKRSKRALAEDAGEAVTTKTKKAKAVKGKKKAVKA